MNLFIAFRYSWSPALLTLAAAAVMVTVASCAGAASRIQEHPPEEQRQPTATVAATPSPAIQVTATPKPGAWRTNLNKYVVDPKVVGPGLPRDSIPPIYEPKFESMSAADSWLADEDLAGVMTIGGQTKVYPYPRWSTTGSAIPPCWLPIARCATR